jgi:hypothetical protein
MRIQATDRERMMFYQLTLMITLTQTWSATWTSTTKFITQVRQMDSSLSVNPQSS